MYSIEFSYDLDGKRHYVSTQRANALGQQYSILTGDKDAILVRCELQGIVGDDIDLYSPHLEINVKPYWAPRGASRFLELVRNKYYDGVAFNRVVPKFLTQFGIAKDYETRTEWESRPILDDFREMRFEPGYIAFAGNGPDSRTTEIFIVMPGTDKEQLEYFGTNSWEAPFAVISNPEKSVLRNFYSGYGDMPPWGQGDLYPILILHNFSFCVPFTNTYSFACIKKVLILRKFMTLMVMSTSLRTFPN